MTNYFDGLNFKLITVLTVLTIIFFSHSAQAADDLCKQGKKSLSGNYDVLQAKGGLWGYMEQLSGLKEKSTLGLGADGKLQRAIVIFEDLCAADKKPDQSLHDKIQKQLMNAVSIHNKSPGKTPVADITTSIEELNKELDELLKTLEPK